MGTKLTVILANGQKVEHQDAGHSITDAGVLTIKIRKNGLEGTQVRTYPESTDGVQSYGRAVATLALVSPAPLLHRRARAARREARHLRGRTSAFFGFNLFMQVVPQTVIHGIHGQKLGADVTLPTPTRSGPHADLRSVR